MTAGAAARLAWQPAAWAALAWAAVLAGCGGGGGGSSGPPAIQVINAVGASGASGGADYDVLFGATSVGTKLGYGQTTGLIGQAAGSTKIVVEPTGTTTSAVTTSLSTANGYDYSVLVIGGAGGGGSSGVATVIVTSSNAAPQAGQAKLAIVHAASGGPALDLYLTAPAAALASGPTVSALTFGGSGTTPSTAALQVAGGAYQLRATAPGDTTRAIKFDSGPITLQANTNLLIAVVPATGSAAALALLVVPTTGTPYQIRDQRVILRAGNLAPADGPLDAYATLSGTTPLTGTLLAQNLSLGGIGSYAIYAPGAYRASLTLTGQNVEQVGANVTLAPGSSTSLYGVGLVGGSGATALKVVPIPDDLSAPPDGQAKVRLLQMAPDLGAVDLVSLDANGAIVRRLAVDLAYPAASASYATIVPGTYRLAAVASGMDAPLLPSATGVTLTATAGGIYSVFVDGCNVPGSAACAGAATPLGLAVVTDQ